MSRPVSLIAAIAAIGALAGCVGTAPDAVESAGQGGASTAPAARGSAPELNNDPSASSDYRATVSVDADPDRLSGLDGAGVEGLLGVPNFRRRDGEAELWRYRHKACALDLFLYPPAGSNGAPVTVRHFAARSHVDKEYSIRACFEVLLRARLVSG